ncbi:cleft lip and palate transmembrane protein 1-domain-containing protein [Gongronella butleri]|nr:cleft lip and palate transmembrane protein 1-domain-containing protein [Gongronella butleri]
MLRLWTPSYPSKTWLKHSYHHLLVPGCFVLLQVLSIYVVNPPTPTPSSTQAQPPTSVSDSPLALPAGVYHNPYPRHTPMHDIPDMLVGLWQHGVAMDLLVYVSQDEYFTECRQAPTFLATDIILGRPFEPHTQKLVIPVNDSKPNDTLYAHIFLTRKNAPIDPAHPSFNPDHVVYRRHPLTKTYPLVQDVPYWQEKVTIALVNQGAMTIPRSALQPATLKHISLESTISSDKMVRVALDKLRARSTTDLDRRIGFYRPIVFPNDFWLLQKHAYPLPHNITELPLTIRIESMAMWKFNSLAVFTDGFGGMTFSEMDHVKQLFLETNPIYIGGLLVTSGLYILFSALSFHHDIQFWKQKQNFDGISLPSLSIQVMSDAVVCLYLLNGGCSWFMLALYGCHLVVGAYKWLKVFGDRRDAPWSTQDAVHFLYWHGLTSTCALMTLYFVFQVLADIGWYAMALGSLAHFIYVFGFAFLLPQVILNHQHKQILHVCKRTLLYKFFNILIDITSAYLIKTPSIHRIAWLHQDILYVVVLFQCLYYARHLK